MSDLYLKEQKVLTLKDIDGVPVEVQKVDAPELLPVCLKTSCTTEDFIKWFENRKIPSNRDGLKELKDEFGSSWLVSKNYCSLSDHYWIKKRTETYKRVNFFTNIYDQDIGNIMFSPWSVTRKRLDKDTPDLTTGGILKKCWKQYADRSSFLVKAGNPETHQEPLSEVLVSVLAETLEIIPCVKYDLHIEGITMCSRCNNFIDTDTELVPAHQIYFSEEKREGEDTLSHLIRMCDKFEIPGAGEFLEAMIVIDNLTGNEDRNLSNIGFIRNINTMKFIGPAPLYDSGNAYWSTKQVTANIKSKLFGSIEEQIVNKWKKKLNMEKVVKNTGYKSLINTYPCITEAKKENLIEAITARNKSFSLGNVFSVER